MATRIVEIKLKRQQYLRAYKRLQHTADTSIEILERRIDRILKNKRPIELETAKTLIPLYNDFVRKVKMMEKGLADFVMLISNF